MAENTDSTSSQAEYETEDSEPDADRSAQPTHLVAQEPAAPPKLFSMQSTDDLFGYRWGNFHPTLGVQLEYTDNLYNLNIAEESSFVTTVSPGLWFGFPRMEEIPVSFVPYNGTVGGNRFLIAGGEGFERLQAYLAAGLDYRLHSADPNIDYPGWRVEGLFQYNMPAGFSFRFLDRYSRDRDRFDRGSFLPEDFRIERDSIAAGTPSFIRDYSSNLANTGLGYSFTDRYSLLLQYSNFLLDYDDDVNSWLNRTDHRFSLSFSYHYSPKTTISAEYSRALVRYDDDAGNDSEYDFYYAGLDWKGTAKSSLAAKAGYQAKKYDSLGGNNDTGAFTLEGRFNYQITDKTGITLSLYKALEETDSFTDRGMDTIAVRLSYEQRFSYRFRGTCEFSYELNDHQGFSRLPDAGSAADREDTTFAVRPGLEYVFRDWLSAGLAYSFENRDSSDNLYDFTSQSLLLTVNIAF